MGRQRGAEVRLLPEEALYLLERGSLDVKWPVVATSGDATTGDATTGDASDQEDHPLHSQQHRQSHQQPEPQPQPQPRHKVSMSLQAAYAAFITANEDVGLPHHLKLDEYTVYAGLKRAGYIVLRTGSHQHDAPPSSASRPVLPGSQSAGAGPSALAALFLTVWKRLFAPMVGGAGIDFVNGPLVKPGLYRSYGEIYRRLGQLIPDSAAEQLARAVPEPDAPLRLTFDVYRPSAAFRKSAPGPPDFRVCVVDARSTAVPTMAQLDHLLGQAPWEPPREDSQLYQRLKHGYRNVLLAVVDQGIVSYLRFAETAFSTQPIYQYRGKGARGGKKGGYRRQRGGRR